MRKFSYAISNAAKQIPAEEEEVQSWSEEERWSRTFASANSFIIIQRLVYLSYWKASLKESLKYVSMNFI